MNHLSENKLTNENIYDESLIHKIYYDNNAFLKALWENNSLSSFWNHNFLLIEDIKLIKGTIIKIFQSKFWKQILTSYSENDVYQSGEFIQQFCEKLIFLPFDVNNWFLWI